MNINSWSGQGTDEQRHTYACLLLRAQLLLSVRSLLPYKYVGCVIPDIPNFKEGLDTGMLCEISSNINLAFHFL